MAALPELLVKVLCVLRTVAALAFTLGIGARPAGLVAGALGYVTVTQIPGRLNTTEHVLFLHDAAGDHRRREPLCSAPRCDSQQSFQRLAHEDLDCFNLLWLHSQPQMGLARRQRSVSLPRRWEVRTMGQRAPAVDADEAALSSAPLSPRQRWRWRPCFRSRARRVGLFAALGLHAGQLAASPDLFGWVMAALLLAFWEPSTPRALAA